MRGSRVNWNSRVGKSDSIPEYRRIQGAMVDASLDGLTRQAREGFNLDRQDGRLGHGHSQDASPHIVNRSINEPMRSSDHPATCPHGMALALWMVAVGFVSLGTAPSIPRSRGAVMNR